MVQLFQQIRLRDQPLLDHLKILNAVFPYFLDGPLFVGPLIHGQIDNTHASLTDFIQYFVFSVYN